MPCFCSCLGCDRDPYEGSNTWFPYKLVHAWALGCLGIQAFGRSGIQMARAPKVVLLICHSLPFFIYHIDLT